MVYLYSGTFACPEGYAFFYLLLYTPEIVITLEQNALLFLLTDIAVADSRIAVWDSKYFYKFWRPITSLNAGPDGSARKNIAWMPLLVTPPHPSYPSGHSATVSAGFTVLRSFFGDKNILTLQTTTSGQQPRTISSLRQGESENGLSRIYGGIHYSFENIQAQALGRRVGEYVLIHGPKKL
jgi:membrane-associated phospholipid phosphatase